LAEAWPMVAVTATVASAWRAFLLARGVAGIAAATRNFFSPTSLGCDSLNRFHCLHYARNVPGVAAPPPWGEGNQSLCATNRGQHAPPLKPQRQRARDTRHCQHERDGETERGDKADLFGNARLNGATGGSRAGRFRPDNAHPRQHRRDDLDDPTRQPAKQAEQRGTLEE